MGETGAVFGVMKGNTLSMRPAPNIRIRFLCATAQRPPIVLIIWLPHRRQAEIRSQKSLLPVLPVSAHFCVHRLVQPCMISERSDAHKAAPVLVFGLILRGFEGLVAPSGIEPELFALRGRRVNQLHHGAVRRVPDGIGLSQYSRAYGFRHRPQEQSVASGRSLGSGSQRAWSRRHDG
jgi:hypothetical protein